MQFISVRRLRNPSPTPGPYTVRLVFCVALHIEKFRWLE